MDGIDEAKARGSSPFDLSGSRALVTGGNTGIGLGMAEGLARAGAAVAIVGRDEEKNAFALGELRSLGSACAAFSFDLADIAGIADFYQTASRAFGGFDVLVNNAGITKRGRADLIGPDTLDAILTVNLKAPFALSQCFARERIEGKAQGGSIIFTASLMSEAVRKDNSPYAASKGAVRQLLKSLAVDWAPYGIRVNGIGPGYIRTVLTRPLWEDQEFSKWVVGRTPLGRWGDPSDFEGAVVFLASRASAFVTGHIIYVDGGWLATF